MLRSIKWLALVAIAWSWVWIFVLLAGQTKFGGHGHGQEGNGAPKPLENAWISRFEQLLPVYGHRNWIVIADSAYPAQVGEGFEIIFTGSDHINLLTEVLSRIAQAAHVSPLIYLDAELSFLDEALAPGVDAYRKRLLDLLRLYRINSLPHLELIQRLEEAGRHFQVLVLKSTLTIPYTSVFMELDCKYWSQEKERLLRARLQGQQ